MIDESSDGDWVSRRNPRIRRPIAGIGHTSPDGIPYLAPEIQSGMRQRQPCGRGGLAPGGGAGAGPWPCAGTRPCAVAAWPAAPAGSAWSAGSAWPAGSGCGADGPILAAAT
jgi:hypothetical protein